MGEPWAPLVVVHVAVGGLDGGRHRLDAVAAGDEQGAIEVGGATISKTEGVPECYLPVDTPQTRLVEHIRGGRLAHLEDQAIGQESRSGGAEVGVTGIVVVPELRGEGVKQLHGRAELQHAVALVIGVRCTVERAVPGGHPDVALGIDGGSRATHPHRALAVAREVGHRVGGWGRAVLGSRHHQPVVGVAVSRIATEADDHPAVGEGQGDSLQLEGRVGAGWVDVLVQQHRSGVDVQADELVGGIAASAHRRHHEDLRASGVDHRGPGDPHGGMDVPAESWNGGRVQRRAEMIRPQHRAGIGGQGVDGVVLRGHEDPTGGHQGLAVQLAIESGRGPRGRRR